MDSRVLSDGVAVEAQVTCKKEDRSCQAGLVDPSVSLGRDRIDGTQMRKFIAPSRPRH